MLPVTAGWTGWLFAVLSGLAWCLPFAPFSAETSGWFQTFPLLVFITPLPLFIFSTGSSVKRAFWQAFVFGAAAGLVQYYWIGFVVAEGLWHLILVGVALLCLAFGVYYALL